ncbi:hypothetical protein [Microbacterium sp. NPDC056736]|uniref:hypothetical protein n=1 Tax=Microbacterium sp. NPDC056736 TaxID=3345932 RepID=UPI00366F40AE
MSVRRRLPLPVRPPSRPLPHAPAGARRDAATELIAVKSTTRELGAGQAPALLQRFVDEELARAEGVRDASAPARSR